MPDGEQGWNSDDGLGDARWGKTAGFRRPVEERQGQAETTNERVTRFKARTLGRPRGVKARIKKDEGRWNYKGKLERKLVSDLVVLDGRLVIWKSGLGFHTNDQSRSLTLPEKLNIAIDVASALEYLHVHCHDPVAHCDLKPSNVLLDDDLTAHLSDFGLARLLYKFDRESFLNQFSSAGVRGTIGYAAPEYGMGGQPSIQGDVYSFGILLMEMFTGKKPTDNSFVGDYNLHSYTKSVLSGDDEEGGGRNAIDEWLRMVLQVGIRCSEEYPRDRMRMAEAVRELISVRSKFFTFKTTNTELNPQDVLQSSPQEWILNPDMHTI